MPNKDGTGPEGKGPKTGRGDGNCDPKQGDSGNGNRGGRRLRRRRHRGSK